MSEEEKQAIEYLKDNKESIIFDMYDTFRINYVKPFEKTLDKILEVVDKQQKEIKQIKENNDYISKNKIKAKIKELEDNVKSFEKTDKTGRFVKENCVDYYKLLVLQELLGESEL